MTNQIAVFDILTISIELADVPMLQRVEVIMGGCEDSLILEHSSANSDPT